MVSRFLNEASSLMEQKVSAKGLSRLKTLHEHLAGKMAILQELDDKIVDACPVGEIEDEIVCDAELSDKIGEARKEITEFCNKANVTNPVVASPPSLPEGDKPESLPGQQQETDSRLDTVTTTPTTTETMTTDSVITVTPISQPKPMPKLPKLIIPKFNGDVKRFRSFWDSFDSAINKNPSMSAVDKFNYLHTLLEGTAARSIQGLALSEANYPAAIGILQDRFGKPHHIIAAHMDEFIKLPECNSDKASQLRLIYDNQCQHSWFGITWDKVRTVWKLSNPSYNVQIASRSSSSDSQGHVWEVEELLKVIKQEVVARELSDTVRVNEKTKNSGKKAFPPTAAALMTGDHTSRRIRCAYCKKEHYSASCVKFSTPEIRREILMREGRCFLFLGTGHRVSQCSSVRRCCKCNRCHHQSICSPPTLREEPVPPPTDIETTQSSTARTRGRVLLQTARTFAYSSDSELLPVRILFDNGSQRSYISHQLKAKLGLKPIKRETLNLNTFGDSIFKKKDCEVVNVTLQSSRDGDISVTTLIFPTICSPMLVRVDIDHYTHLQGLALADCLIASESNNDHSGDTVDLLIGSDYYWEL